MNDLIIKYFFKGDLGCFNDSYNTGRQLQGLSYSAGTGNDPNNPFAYKSDSMSQLLCFKLCSSLNFAYYGVEWG